MHLSKLIKMSSGFAISMIAFANLTTAAVIFNDSFSYTTGNLVGQGGWTETAAATPANQIQVNAGGTAAVLGTAGGTDLYSAFASPQNLASAGTFYFAADIVLSSAKGTGDYFLHLSDPAGTTSLFYSRIFAKTSGTGFVLGFLDTSGTGSATTFGSTTLDFSTSYKVVVAWTSVAGTLNDTFKLYINPASPTESSNSTYLTHTWTSANAEPATIAAFNLRQGSSTQSAGVTVDSLVAATTFGEAAGLAAVPEPSTYAALVGVAALASVAMRRRRQV